MAGATPRAFEHSAQQRVVFFLHTLQAACNPPSQPRQSLMRAGVWLAAARVGEAKGEGAPGVEVVRGALGVAGGAPMSIVLFMPS